MWLLKFRPTSNITARFLIWYCITFYSVSRWLLTLCPCICGPQTMTIAVWVHWLQIYSQKWLITRIWIGGTQSALSVRHHETNDQFLLWIQVYVSYDYGATFTVVTGKFQLSDAKAKNGSTQIISQFYHSPADNKRVSGFLFVVQSRGPVHTIRSLLHWQTIAFQLTHPEVTMERLTGLNSSVANWTWLLDRRQPLRLRLLS